MSGDSKLVDWKEALSEALVREGFARERIATRETPGVLGTTVLTATAAGAYPGAGVKTAVRDGKAIYGRDFPEQLAALARARGWLAAPPEVEALVTLFGQVHFGGLLAVDREAGAPALSRDGGGLVLELVRRSFPSGARERLKVRLPEVGAEEITVSSGEPPAEPQPTPIDQATGLLRAVAAGNPMAILAAVRALPAPRSKRELQALAAAAVSANGTVSATALLKIGDGDGAAEALREALQSTPEGLRATILANVADTHGAAFAARLS